MIRSEKTKRRQSESHKGRKSYMFGKKKSPEQILKNKLAHTGNKNSRYDHTVYKFYNSKLKVVETCTQYELRKKYNLDSGGLHLLISKKRYSVKGWTLGVTLEEIEHLRRKKISSFHSGRPKSASHRKNLWKNRV